MLKFISLCLSVVLLVGSAVSLSACGKVSGVEGSESNPVKIGVVGASDPQWNIFKQAAAKEGIFVNIMDFAEYSEPNPALSQSQLDMNEFQHLLFLANYNKSSNSDLVPIKATAVFPIGLYGDSTKGIKKLNDIKEGDKIAIPNDGTNQSRALFLLKNAQLIKLTDDTKKIVTPLDIDTNNSKVTVMPVAASEVSRNLTDPTIKAGVINNDFVKYLSDDNKDNILTFEKADSEGAKPYINAFVVRSEDKNNELYLKLADIYNTDKNVQNALIEASGGSKFIDTSVQSLPQNELSQILSNLQSSLN